MLGMSPFSDDSRRSHTPTHIDVSDVQLGLRSISVVSTGPGLGDTCRICSLSKLADPVRRTFRKNMPMVKEFIPVSINAEGK
jgi:hypothetical protein